MTPAPSQSASTIYSSAGLGVQAYVLQDDARAIDGGDASPAVVACEQLLKVLRASLQTSDEARAFAAKMYVSDWRSGGFGQHLAELRLKGEGKWGWDEYYFSFYKHERAWKDKKPGNAPYLHLPLKTSSGRQAFTQLHQSPDWFRLTTEDRIGFGTYIPVLLESLRGQPVSVSPSSSWGFKETKGRRTTVEHYQVLVCPDFSGKSRFNPEPLIGSYAQAVCMAKDSRADGESLFEYQKERVPELLFQSYQWTRTGFIASTEFKRDAEAIGPSLFPDCKVTLEPEIERGKTVGWTVEVVFPE